jgi:hypothetical protein
LKPLVEPVGSRHRLASIAGALALLAFALLLLAGRASADQIYWVNQNHSIAYSQLDDTAGGFLPESVNAIHNGRGVAIDTANSRVYVAQEATDQIVWFSLNGIGHGVVNTAPGSVDNPVNVAIEPATQTLYWANDTSPGSIGFASANEAGGGILVEPGTTGATVSKPSRIAIDTLRKRVYWWNEDSENFSWVATNGLIGSDLLTPGLSFQQPEGLGGMVIEPYSTPQELYFINNEARGIFHTDPLLGGPPELVIGTATTKTAIEPTGLAFDGTANKFYWANSLIDEEPKSAIGTGTIFGHPMLIPVYPIAPIHAPAFAAILKTPVDTGDPEITVSEDTLSCTLGHWEVDFPGASVYAAPTTYTYEWRKGSTPIVGQNASSMTATETGSYSCAVVGENAAGATTEVSRAKTVTLPDKPKETTTKTTTTTTTTTTTPPAKTKPAPKTKTKTESATVGVKLPSTKAVKVKAGGTATIKVDLSNPSGATAGAIKVCGTVPKQSKTALKAPACVSVKSLAPGAAFVAKLKVKTLASAAGTYKLTVALSGAAKGSLTAKVQVAPRANHK